MEVVDGEAEITGDGGTLQLKANVTPTNASNKNVTWSVDDPRIATIDQTGLLTAVADGTITVTATAKDGSGKKGELVVEISGQSAVIVTSDGELATALADSTRTTIILDGTFNGFKVNRDVTIQGGTINPVKVEGTISGILVDASKTVVIDGVTINGTDIAGQVVGIETQANVKLTVKNAKINNVTTGIYLNPGSVLTATGNTISNAVAGIGSDKADLTGDISNNTFDNCGEAIGLGLPINKDGGQMSRQEAEALAGQLVEANELDAEDVVIYGNPVEETGIEGLDTEGRRVSFFETITAALAEDSVAAILVSPGEYKEAVAIRKPLRLIGAGSDKTTIDMSGLTNERYGIEILASDVVVEGFKIIGHTEFDDDSAGIGHESGKRGGPQSVQNIQIRDVVVETHHDGIKFRGASNGRSQNILIESVEVKDCIDTGLKFWNVENSTIRNAVSHGHLYKYGDKIRKDEGIALEVKASDKITVENVEVYDSQRGFLVWEGGSHVLSNVTARDMKTKLSNEETNFNADGFKFDYYAGDSEKITTIELVNAISTNNPTSGVRARNTDLTIIGGTFSGNGNGEIRSGWDSNRAISVERYTKADIQGVTFGNNPIAIAFDQDANVVDSNVTGCVFESNEFGIKNKADAVVCAAHNYWNHESGPYHASQNTSGQGNAVSGNVLFYPWYKDAELTTLHVISGIVNTRTLDAYSTIQKAVNDAESGDTILVDPGAYRQDLVIGKENLTLKSTAGPDTTTIQGNIKISGDNVTIEGFTIDGEVEGPSVDLLQVILDSNEFAQDSVVVKVDDGAKIVPSTEVDVVNVTQKRGYATIEAAVDVAQDGDTISVASGTYVLSDTGIQIKTGIEIIGQNEVFIKAPDRKSAFKIDSGTGAVTLRNLSIQGAYSNPETFKIENHGVYISRNATGKVTLENVEINGFWYGLFSDSDIHNDGSLNQPNSIEVYSCKFEDNKHKAIYVERTDSIIIDNSEFVGNAGYTWTTSQWFTLIAVDINLKYNDYQNVEITNNTFFENGGKSPTAPGHLPFEAYTTALGIKARDDAPSYNNPPARLANVTVVSNVFGDNVHDVQIGEPGKGNMSPVNISLKNNKFLGTKDIEESVYTVANDVKDMILDASHNYWGNEPNFSNLVKGTIVFYPWWSDENMTVESYGDILNAITVAEAAIAALPDAEEFSLSDSEALEHAGGLVDSAVDLGALEDDIEGIEKLEMLKAIESAIWMVNQHVGSVINTNKLMEALQNEVLNLDNVADEYKMNYVQALQERYAENNAFRFETKTDIQTFIDEINLAAAEPIRAVNEAQTVGDLIDALSSETLFSYYDFYDSESGRGVVKRNREVYFGELQVLRQEGKELATKSEIKLFVDQANLTPVGQVNLAEMVTTFRSAFKNPELGLNLEAYNALGAERTAVENGMWDYVKDNDISFASKDEIQTLLNDIIAEVTGEGNRNEQLFYTEEINIEIDETQDESEEEQLEDEQGTNGEEEDGSTEGEGPVDEAEF